MMYDKKLALTPNGNDSAFYRQVAESILLQQIGAEVIVAAPQELLYDTGISSEWLKGDNLLKRSTRFCHHLEIIFLQNRVIEKPITFLAEIDKLYVIADDIITYPNFGGDLKLSESIEELLWKAIKLRIPAHYYFIDGHELAAPHPKTDLKKRGVPERVAAKDEERRKYTSKLTVVRLDCDWSSSGLWDERGAMISYDYIDLPLSLIRHIIDWHEEFDATLETGQTDRWQKRHERKKHKIALKLQNTLGLNVDVQILTDQDWTSITSVAV